MTDAGCVVLAGHGVGDDDEVGGEMSGDAFGGPEEGAGGGSLEWAERGAVDGVEDQGDAGGAGGEASHDAGLSAVGMDDVGLTSAQLGGEGDPGAEVEHGADGADEGGNECEEIRGAGELGFERTFGPRGGPADEMCFHAREAVESEHGGDRVLLGATHDKAGDDVGDPHWAMRPRRTRDRRDQPPVLPAAMASSRCWAVRASGLPVVAVSRKRR